MKKVMIGLLAFLATMSYARCDSQFHFDDCVKVTSGFYEGCVGRVKDTYDDNKYDVALSCKNGDTVTVGLDGKALALQKDYVCAGKE